MQRMEVKGFSTGSQHGQVVLEDPDGMVQLSIRMRPMMAHWLAHEAQGVPVPSRVDVSTTPRASYQIWWSLTRQPY